ncbi:hypothetical protein ASD8599_00677 [Ascidiaceihabitans donghaensis]|uniref:N-acetyltransferase domain-containing protein n=1 Tax=Ascidiaceihabitans donghaensis TaxID=1510460 RepID=A0A2R8BA71_9RHOB|nr:GNAT family N-acetyltransferase [Ascidiaceihabitans donghaensis]SPH19937.1 hypothetical protein ASD8599_00677 [Ascidiaceihabitans donghaensis]
MTRFLTSEDAENACALLAHLMPDIAAPTAFATLIDHPGTFIAGAHAGGDLIAMATLHLMPNMTQSGRPYGVIENVVTHPDHRGKGHMRGVMAHLHKQAWQANAYKIMLMTGRDTGAKGFYEKLGYSADQKHGMQIRQVPPRTTHTK